MEGFGNNMVVIVRKGRIFDAGLSHRTLTRFSIACRSGRRMPTLKTMETTRLGSLQGWLSQRQEDGGVSCALCVVLSAIFVPTLDALVRMANGVGAA
ncbi:hypothetical protein SUGI_0547440 [Cryptomeria japonica]|nr:hypothetical protein SUGI_0547440 [Cryptomeria japonica]